MTDAILTRVARGDAGALRACIDEYGGLVWNLARRLSRTSSDAEDATQEIFLQLWTQAKRFDVSRGSEKTFIAMIARRRLIDRMRKAHREPLTGLDYESLSVSDWAGSADTSELCVEAEKAGQVLRELPGLQRQVIELGCVFGLTHSEIASRLEMPLGTVKTSMRRGLIKLRERLSGESEPADRLTSRNPTSDKTTRARHMFSGGIAAMQRKANMLVDVASPRSLSLDPPPA